MGDFHLVLTRAKNVWPGMPPSRAKAYIIREFEVIEKVLGKRPEPQVFFLLNKSETHPQKYIAPMTMTYQNGWLRQVALEQKAGTCH